jgi:predicted  nucleic acid-binding Zn-ribbon protein
MKIQRKALNINSLAMLVAVEAAIVVLGTPGQMVLAASEREDVANARVKQSKDHSKRLAAAVSEIPGVNVRPQDLEPPDKQNNFSLNPIGWLFKPITQLQRQSITLQQQIMRLEGPIGAMQPTMLGLRDQMVRVQGKMGEVDQQMTRVEGEMHNVRSGMTKVKDDVQRMRQTLTRLEGPITRLERPIQELHEPVVRLQSPLSNVHDQMNNLQGQLTDLKQEIRTTSTFILLAIFLATMVIAVGTPIAGLIVWLNRRRLFPDRYQQHGTTTRELSLR